MLYNKGVKRSIDDPMNGNKDDMIWYTNFVLDQESSTFVRIQYNYLNVIENIGGIIQIITIICALILVPFNYKRHELVVLK